MPFIGSIPAPLRAIISEQTGAWSTDEIWVACSGNFTIERALEGRFRFHSNDVSVYTSALGAWLAGDDLPLEVKDEHQPEWGWLTKYLQTPIDRAATVMIGTAAFVGLQTGKSNPYYDRLREAYKSQWESIHQRTVAKLEAKTLRLDSYTPADAAEWVKSVPEDGAIISFPPFYEGGYEQLYKGLDELLTWDVPEYEVMDRDGLHAMLDVMESRKFWAYGTDHRVDERGHPMRGVVESKGSAPIYVYSSHGTSRAVSPQIATEPVFAPRLREGDTLGRTLTLALLSARQYASLRAQYLAANILPATPAQAVGVLCDGLLIGGFAFSPETMGRGAYLVSDFPVTPTDYPRLSKLIVAAALSTEARVLAERALNHRVRSILTSAFSDRPVSMKYRGMFQLVKREKGSQGREYRLDYRSDSDRWSLAEALENWRATNARATAGAGAGG